MSCQRYPWNVLKFKCQNAVVGFLEKFSLAKQGWNVYFILSKTTVQTPVFENAITLSDEYKNNHAYTIVECTHVSQQISQKSEYDVVIIRFQLSIKHTICAQHITRKLNQRMGKKQRLGFCCSRLSFFITTIWKRPQLYFNSLFKTTIMKNTFSMYIVVSVVIIFLPLPYYYILSCLFIFLFTLCAMNVLYTRY